MICNKCGKETPEDSKFCIYCGSNDLKKQYTQEQIKSINKFASHKLLIIVSIVILTVLIISSISIINSKLFPKTSNAENKTDEIESNNIPINKTGMKIEKIVYEAIINKDKSMYVTETWKCSELKNTKTIYKTFKLDSNKYKEISNVKVSQILEYENIIDFQQVDEWKYHLDNQTYYAGMNNDGEFEIAWGVNSDDSNNNEGIYMISYNVDDVVKMSSEYAEVYWTFIGSQTASPIEEVFGTIEVFDEYEDLNNVEIFADSKTDVSVSNDEYGLNFEGRNFKYGDYLDVRVLIPINKFKEIVKSSNNRTVDEPSKTNRNYTTTQIESEEKTYTDAELSKIIMDSIYVRVAGKEEGSNHYTLYRSGTYYEPATWDEYYKLNDDSEYRLYYENAYKREEIYFIIYFDIWIDKDRFSDYKDRKKEYDMDQTTALGYKAKVTNNSTGETIEIKMDDNAGNFSDVFEKEGDSYTLVISDRYGNSKVLNFNK